MARSDPDAGLMPSILDRLIDPESGGTAWRPGYGVEQTTAVVHRDLEELLNTRRCVMDKLEQFPEVHHSVFCYGLPDLVSLNAISPQQRQEIGRVIEATISQFEPRLKDVRAVLVDPGGSKERSIRFHIEARLRLDPAPDVTFDTILELTTGHYTVKPST